MKIMNQPTICQSQQFRGFAPGFSYENVKKSFNNGIVNAIKAFEPEIENSQFIDIAMKPDAEFGDGLSIKTKTPYITETSVLEPGCDIYVNANTNQATQEGSTLHIPVGIGEIYNDSPEKLVLNFNDEEKAKDALEALQKSCYDGFYAKRTPVLAMLMEHSARITEALKTIRISKQSVTFTLNKVKQYL